MVLFILQPFRSHFYPTFSLAKNLAKQGQDVIYATKPFLNEVVASEGFKFREFHYLSEYLIKNHKAFLGFFLKSIISKEFLNNREKEFETAYKATRLLLEDCQPTNVYLDQSLADYYFFIKPFVKEITIVHTKFYSGKVKGIPPMNSTYVPQNSWISYLICEWHWYNLLSKLRWGEFLLKAAFLGKNEAYFWKRYCRNHGMNWSARTDFKHALNRGIKNVDTLVLAPEDLEFSNFTKPGYLRFYDNLSIKDETKYYSKNYVAFKSQYLISKKKIVVYLAFGTLAMGNPKIEGFFNDVLSIVAQLPDTLLIISKGHINMQLISTKNSMVFDFVPQLDVLSYSDLFITHGGLGSVKEAYHAKVPMLVVPFNNKTDMAGNAARVKARGLGDYLNLEKYSNKELQQKITRLLPPNKIKSTPANAINNQLA